MDFHEEATDPHVDTVTRVSAAIVLDETHELTKDIWDRSVECIRQQYSCVNCIKIDPRARLVCSVEVPLEAQEQPGSFVLVPSSEDVHSTLELPGGCGVLSREMDTFGRLFTGEREGLDGCPGFKIRGIQEVFVGAALIVRIFECETKYGTIKACDHVDPSDLEWVSDNITWVGPT